MNQLKHSSLPYEPTIKRVIFTLTLIAAYFRLAYFLSHPLPDTYDGFYYLQQVKSLCTGVGDVNKLHYFYNYILSIIASLSSCNAPLSLVLAELSTLTILTISLTAIAWISGGLLFGISIALLTVSSNQIFHQVVAAPAQTFAFSILCGGIACFLRWERNKDQTFLFVLSCFLILLASTLHIYVSLLCLAVLLIFYYTRLSSKRERWTGLLTINIVLVFLVAHIMNNPKNISEKILSSQEILSSIGTLKSYFSPYQYIEFHSALFITFTLCCMFIIYRVYDRRAFMFALLFVLTIAPAYVNIWTDSLHPGTFSDRVPQVSILLFALFLSMLPQKSIKSSFLRPFTYATPVISSLCFFYFSYLYPFHKQRIGPELQYQTILASLPLLKAYSNESDYYRAPHGVQFMISYFLGNDSTREIPHSHNTDSYIHIVRTHAADSCLSTLPIAEDAKCISLGPSWSAYRIKVKTHGQ